MQNQTTALKFYKQLSFIYKTLSWSKFYSQMIKLKLHYRICGPEIFCSETLKLIPFPRVLDLYKLNNDTYLDQEKQQLNFLFSVLSDFLFQNSK